MTNKMETLQKDQYSLQALQNQVTGSVLQIRDLINTVVEIMQKYTVKSKDSGIISDK